MGIFLKLLHACSFMGFLFLPNAEIKTSNQVIPGYSEQHPPLYLGIKPSESLVYQKDYPHPRLPAFMKELAEIQSQKLLTALGIDHAEFEAWPTKREDGLYTWVYAFWRKSAADKMQWLDDSLLDGLNEPESEQITALEVLPELPKVLNPRSPDDFEKLFSPFWKLNSLYQKPLFGQVLWTNRSGNLFYKGWLSPDLREEGERYIVQHPELDIVARMFSQPAQWNGKPVSFTLHANKKGIEWRNNIEWIESHPHKPASITAPLIPTIKKWPQKLAQVYKEDVTRLAGEKPLVFPISGRKVRLMRKNCAQADHQLGTLEEYLEERYALLGIKTFRQNFVWNGIRQANLIAVLPGTLPPALNKPVLMADHIDTAFAEDIYKITKERVSVPGADDNATSTAALLAAAKILKNQKHAHDIWLVHLSCEEYPGDSLGARELLGSMLKARRQISGLVLLDMIGYNDSGKNVLQVNPGLNVGSELLAKITADAVQIHAKNLSPVLRHPLDMKSYLYNTDGIVFSDLGYPVVLLNEEVNRTKNLERDGYHDSTDTTKTLDFEYAISIAKVAIETVAKISQGEVQ